MWSELALYLPGPGLTQRLATGQGLFVVSIQRKEAEKYTKPNGYSYPVLRAEPGFTVLVSLCLLQEVISIQQHFKRNIHEDRNLHGVVWHVCLSQCCLPQENARDRVAFGEERFSFYTFKGYRVQDQHTGRCCVW